VIATLEKLGLARNVVRISPERQQQRLAAAAPAAVPTAGRNASADLSPGR
jgi:hypothetical protein